MATRIPINKDSYNFEDRQKKIWEDMERDMERRRRDPMNPWGHQGREWEDEIDKMRKEFFHLRPENAEFAGIEGSGSASRLPARISGRIHEADDGKAIVEKDERGQPVFKVRFNMKEYKPEEVNVKMDSNKIMVSARHEEKGGGSSVSREYSREVNIPREVDPLALQCTLNPDGYLVVHAPLPAPSYNAIRDSSASQSSPGVMKSSSTYQTSSSTASKPQFTSVAGPAHTYSQPHSPQIRTHTITQQQAPVSHSKPPPTKSPSMHSQEEVMSHPDHVVPQYKPPPDISKLDVRENAMQGRVSPSFHSSTSSHLQNSAFPKPPPFSQLNSSFPSGPIFSESSSQAQLSTPMVTSHDGKFQLTMPIDDYKPEELTVKTQDGKVIICAKRQVQSGNRTRTMEMNREHSLPDNVDPLTVKAFFTDTNNLIVEAPFLRS